MIWEAALSEIAKSPILGRGVGAAETVISSSFHNAYLEVWFNTGFIGFLFFITAQFYFLLRIIFMSLVNKYSEVKSTLALSLGYILSFMLMSLVESTGSTASSVNLILFLFIGVYISSNELTKFTCQAEIKEGIAYPAKILRGAFEKNLS
jgi:O-antigen ligase